MDSSSTVRNYEPTREGPPELDDDGAENPDETGESSAFLDLREALTDLRDRKVMAAVTSSEVPPTHSEGDSIDNETDSDGLLPPPSSFVLVPSVVQHHHTPLTQEIISRARSRNEEDRRDAAAELLSEYANTEGTDTSQLTTSSAVPVTKLPLHYAALRMAPIAFFYGLAAGIIGPVFTELLKIRVCEMELKYSVNTCLHLAADEFKTENSKVLGLTSHYSFLIMLVGSLPCVIFAIFTGSWSDHFGRKLPMMIPYCGMLLSTFLLLLLTYLPTHPAVLLIVPLVAALFGGWIITAAASYSYISDYSAPTNLAIDLAVFDGIFGLASNLGTLVGGVMYGLYGFAYPFALYGTFLLFTILYILLVIRDRRVLSTEFHRRGCQALFTTQNLGENKQMLIKERTANTRRHIFLLLVCTAIAAACTTGNSSINQLFFETPPLGWTMKSYTIFSCVSGVITCLVMIGTIPILKKMIKMKDTAIGILGVTSAILSYLVLSATERSWMAVAAVAVGVLSGLQYVAARTLLSNLVDEDERGKMMSVIASLQATVPILGSFLFTTIFSASVSWWPGFPYAVASLVMMLVLSGFCYIDMQRRGFVYNENAETRYAKLS
ncbi:hypothetical protein BV898_11252 [Hypsibius exemplaris]|uniref:Major facilitator superfamily (MFS) profile domain-containing protein n=1 Tax=Hypsibius exemplaris TaxID=2072580 RepID=A0A1W0WH48_HYPEX|nr:hypothetical protein BV898_11252 [Hypsibius exemplaris]